MTVLLFIFYHHRHLRFSHLQPGRKQVKLTDNIPGHVPGVLWRARASTLQKQGILSHAYATGPPLHPTPV